MNLTIDQLLQQAIKQQQSGNLKRAERLYRTLLQKKAHHAQANYQLGLLYLAQHKTVDALALFKTALNTKPTHIQYWLSYLEGLIQTQQIHTARAVLLEARQRGLTDKQLDVYAQRLLAMSEPSATQITQIVQLFEQANYQEVAKQAQVLIAQCPEHGFAWKALGAVLPNLGDLQTALAVQKRSVELLPNDANALYNLANTLKKLHQLPEAEKYYRQAIAANPQHAESYNNLALVLHDLARLTEAEQSYHQAIKRDSNNAEFFYNLGITLQELTRFQEAEICYRKAITLKPHHAQAYNNLGNIFQQYGHFIEAENHYRHALNIKSDYIDAQSNLLFTANYVQTHSNEQRISEAKSYGALVAQKVKQRYNTWHCLIPPKRLRIGLVSGDFHNHSVGHFLEAVLAHLTNHDCDIIAYSNCAATDDVTARIKVSVTHWRDIFNLDDAKTAQLIHQDAIHILIDLAGHTANNRLPVFAWKPAPIQITWLGYLATTGVTEIDYILADAYSLFDSDAFAFTEKIWRLPESFQCFTPPAFNIQVNSLPALQNGYITFGCFNNLSKINDTVIATWATILRLIPNAKLFLKCNQLANPALRKHIQQAFAKLNIAPERLILEGRSKRREDLLSCYQRVDITLDPFPYPGVTTSIESLWMGVPVLTLSGNRFLSRASNSIAHYAGLSTWIAQDTDDYVQKAVAYTANLKQLAELRYQLRSQVLNSALFDAPRFAKNFIHTLWNIWQTHQSITN